MRVMDHMCMPERFSALCKCMCVWREWVYMGVCVRVTKLYPSSTKAKII
jgi:hypothetical protein